MGIILIILSHVVQTLHSENSYVGYQDYVLPLGVATLDTQILILNILRYSGVFGNTIFFISSAWYLLDSKKVIGKKIVFMLVEIWVVSVLIMMIFGVVYQGSLDVKLMIKSLFPTTFSLNWYLTCYILFYAMHPFLNKVIYAINQRTLLRSSLIMSLLYIFMNYIVGGLFQSSTLILWVAIYFCIAYMKLYLQDISRKKLFNWILILLGIGGNCIIVMLTNFMGLRVGFFENKLFHWNTNCSPLLIMATIGMLNMARCSDFKNIVVNKISGLSLLIYIVHENIFVRNYLRPYIWHCIYKVYGYDQVLLWTIIQAVAILTVTLITCYIYKLIFGKIVNKFLEKIYYGFCKIYEKAENILLQLK